VIKAHNVFTETIKMTHNLKISNASPQTSQHVSAFLQFFWARINSCSVSVSNICTDIDIVTWLHCTYNTV